MNFDPIHFLVQLVIAVFLIRFHANAYRLGRNPILEKINQLTNPVVLPFSRLIPARRRDIGALIVALIIAILAAFLLTRPLPLPLPAALIIGTLQLFFGTWLDLVMYSLIIVVIGSWLQTDPRQPLMQLMLACNEWIMAPLRRIIPSFGGLDFSPIIVLFGVQFGKYALGKLSFHIAFAMIGGHF
ncbi:MAG: YggT family protein [Cardiobacteriaceae bacterium]|nr:YggT family protein [Cardiobacteriaceae bacterium]